MHNPTQIHLSKKPNQTLMNSVNIIGRVGGEVELRYTAGGKAVAQLTLAVDDGWGDNKKTAWIGVTIWGVTAELAQKAVQKGDRLGITGRLSQEEWEDKATGKKQRKTKVTCDSMHLIEPKRGNQPEPSQRQEARPEQPQAAQQHEDDDIPF